MFNNLFRLFANWTMVLLCLWGWKRQLGLSTPQGAKLAAPKKFALLITNLGYLNFGPEVLVGRINNSKIIIMEFNNTKGLNLQLFNNRGILFRLFANKGAKVCLWVNYTVSILSKHFCRCLGMWCIWVPAWSYPNSTCAAVGTISGCGIVFLGACVWLALHHAVD